MADLCPTCGRELPSDAPLRVDLDANVAIANGVVVELTPKEAELLNLIASAKGRVTTYDFLIEHLYLLDERESDIIKVMVCKIRQKIAKTGVQIETIWGKGYRISHKQKENA